MSKQLKIGVYLIATNKYKQFVIPFLLTMDRYFFKGHKLKVYLFTDDPNYFKDSFNSMSIDVFLVSIPAYKFPHATLYRYKILSEHKNIIDCDWIFYSDVDMAFVGDVGVEILPNQGMENLIAVRHCGFYNMGGGGWGDDMESKSYIPRDKRKFYYAGGFQGGSRECYLMYAQQMADDINIDESNGVMAVWHDETFWNSLLSKIPSFKELDPSYCMVEQKHLRVKWLVDDLSPKLLALEKNHKEIRE